MKKANSIWLDQPQAIMVIKLNRVKAMIHSDFQLFEGTDKISSSYDEDFNPYYANPVLDDISLVLLLEPNEPTCSFKNPLRNKVFVSVFSLANRPKL